ncbi:MAG: zinc ribbon domain-containing protein [Elusimicrobiota bacterium]|nr:zinc ribbon domain-containing protein [Elusimicrobiota bacterium]
MPIFNYKCNKCGSSFEEFEGVIIKEEELKCPECSNMDVEKALSTFSVGAGKSSASPAPSRQTGGCSTGICPPG